MPRLLHIDSSPIRKTSISRNLSSEYVRQWKQNHPEGEVIARDLHTSNLVSIDGDWVTASFTPKSLRDMRQAEILGFSDALIAELRLADEYVIGVCMHNFGIPSVLKLWIDQVVRLGETFEYVDGIPTGQLRGKKVTFVIATGGFYGEGSTMASFNFVEPYLRNLFIFLGVTDINVITADRASVVLYGKTDLETYLQPHLDSIRVGSQWL